MAKNKKNNKQAKADSNSKKWSKEFKAEIKKIVWPTKSEMVENSVVVISMVVIVALIIFVLDLAFKSLNGLEVEAVKKLDKNTTNNSISTNVTNGVTSNSVSVNATATGNTVDATWTNSAATTDKK